MENQQKKLIKSLLGYAAQRDISPEKLCKLSNITLEELHLADEPLSEKQVRDVWNNAVALTNDPLFGLHFGESLQLTALGIVGDIIKSSQTVGEALTMAVSLVPYITPDITLNIIHSKNDFTIHYQPLAETWKQSPVTSQMLSLLMIFTIHEVDGLVWKKIKPDKVTYTGNIDDAAEISRVMRYPINEVSEENSISFEKSYWDLPLISADRELQSGLMEKMPEFKDANHGTQTLHNRIYNYLLGNSYLGMVSLNDISANFNISTRTLQRKLKEEGFHFQQITDKVRKDLAINYLKAGDVPVKQISYLLGYNEISAFTRTFKRWTGITPGKFMSTHSHDQLN